MNKHINRGQLEKPSLYLSAKIENHKYHLNLKRRYHIQDEPWLCFETQLNLYIPICSILWKENVFFSLSFSLFFIEEEGLGSSIIAGEYHDLSVRPNFFSLANSIWHSAKERLKTSGFFMTSCVYFYICNGEVKSIISHKE